MSYEHTQSRALLAGVVFVAAVAFAIAAVVVGEPAMIVAPIVLALVAFVAYALSSLRSSVGPEAIEVAFRFGRPRRVIPVSQVVRAEVVRNRWWYGWGIRWFPGGILWNVWGLDAVHLDLAGTRNFRIGTDDPDGLLAAIQATVPDAGVDGCWGT